MPSAIVQKSADFLQAVLTKRTDLFDFVLYFERVSFDELVALVNDEKMIVWINLYNAYTQLELQNSKTGKIYASMFTEELFTVAGQSISLDIIEHGILRGNTWKYGFGYIKGFQLPSRLRHWKCKNPDNRIHFLLNCGAASCPIIRVLDNVNLSHELHMAEKEFIENEVWVEHDQRKLRISGLFLFYLGDFGGKRGLLNLFGKYIECPSYSIKFLKFDWSTQPYKVKK